VAPFTQQNMQLNTAPKYPTKRIHRDNGNTTVVTSNVSTRQRKMCAPSTHPSKPTIPITHAVANTGTTSVMVMKDTPMNNVRPATNPLNINLPDGTMVKSMHVCNLEIPGLPYVLEGHIVPDLTMALLIVIRILCKMGCIIVFIDTACYVRYQGEVILTGYKDPSTDLWVLPITPDAIKSHKKQLQTSPGMARAPQSPVTLPTPSQRMDGAMFAHSM
jgi:hypothetical protein